MKTKFIGFIAGIAALMPGLASAAAYSTTTAGTDFTNVISDLGTMIGSGVTATLGGMAALIGLGFAVRHFTRRVSGKKF